MIELTNNNTRGPQSLELSFEAFEDEGKFILVSIRSADGEDIIEALIPAGEVSNFFYEVDETKAEWDRMDGGQ